VIVADASAISELLLARPRASAIRRAISAQTELHVPAHFDLEVMSALRRYALRGQLSDRDAARALTALADLRALTYPVRELIGPIWELRFGLTSYDAAYLALAQRLDAGLITLDKALASAAAADGRLVALGD
jgi:predicted nucleic acid-binding protein